MGRNPGAQPDFQWDNWLLYGEPSIRLVQESDFSCDVESLRNAAMNAAKVRCVKIKTHVDRTGPFNVLEITILESPDAHRLARLADAKKQLENDPESEEEEAVDERDLPGFEEWASGLVGRNPEDEERDDGPSGPQ